MMILYNLYLRVMGLFELSNAAMVDVPLSETFVTLISTSPCSEASRQRNTPMVAAPGPNAGVAKVLQAASKISCLLLLANQSVTRMEEANATAKSHFSRW